MTHEQAMKAWNEIISATERLSESKDLSFTEILRLMALIQTSQVKVLAHLMVEIEKLKMEGERR